LNLIERERERERERKKEEDHWTLGNGQKESQPLHPCDQCPYLALTEITPIMVTMVKPNTYCGGTVVKPNVFGHHT